MFKLKENIFITRMKYFSYSHVNDTSTPITPSLVAKTFLLENGRGGKALGKRFNLDSVLNFFSFFPINFIMLFKQSSENYVLQHTD